MSSAARRARALRSARGHIRLKAAPTSPTIPTVDTPVPTLPSPPKVDPEPAPRKRSILQWVTPEALARLTPEEQAQLEAAHGLYEPEPLRTPTPEGLARFDAFLASLAPREREFLDELNRFDQLDNKRDQ